MTLTQIERKRCAHSEREMSPSGRYSTCSRCLLRYYKKAMKPVEYYKNREHVRFCFNKPMSEDDAASVFIGLSYVSYLPVELAREEDGMAFRVYSTINDTLTLVRAAEWFANRKWNNNFNEALEKNPVKDEGKKKHRKGC